MRLCKEKDFKSVLVPLKNDKHEKMHLIFFLIECLFKYLQTKVPNFLDHLSKQYQKSLEYSRFIHGCLNAEEKDICCTICVILVMAIIAL